MKAFVKCVPASLGKGLHRVARALARHAPPEITIVETVEEADLVVQHVIGHGSMRGWNLRDDQRTAMLQYCLLTTEDARYTAWYPHWKRARVVWSYYDLADFARKAIVKGEIPDGCYSESLMPNFYHAPLGVDGSVFRPEEPVRKRFGIGTSGFVADTEGVWESYFACRKTQMDLFHLGPNLQLGSGVLYMNNISDEDVSDFWSQCRYVAGLRRIEGFELPALEGLASGSRPVVFDAPHYRRWFGEHAEYVPETDADSVTAALVELLSKPVRPVTPAERAHALEIFDWRKLVTGFWEKALS